MLFTPTEYVASTHSSNTEHGVISSELDRNRPTQGKGSVPQTCPSLCAGCRSCPSPHRPFNALNMSAIAHDPHFLLDTFLCSLPMRTNLFSPLGRRSPTFYMFAVHSRPPRCICHAPSRTQQSTSLLFHHHPRRDSGSGSCTPHRIARSNVTHLRPAGSPLNMQHSLSPASSSPADHLRLRSCCSAKTSHPARNADKTITADTAIPTRFARPPRRRYRPPESQTLGYRVGSKSIAPFQ